MKQKDFDIINWISVRPWSKVALISQNNIFAIIKILNSQRSTEVELLTQLNSYHIYGVPKVRKLNDYSFLMDFYSDITSKVEIKNILEIYVKIQTLTFNLNLFCPKYSADSHLNFLKSRSADNDNILQYFSKNNLKKVGNLISEMPMELQLLEHNDLHIGNMMISQCGDLLIIDWADALIAPIGFSLVPLFGSFPLFVEELNSNNSDLDFYCKEISHFFKRNLNHIKNAILVGAFTGEIHRILDFQLFYNSEARDFIISKITLFNDTFDANYKLLCKRIDCV